MFVGGAQSDDGASLHHMKGHVLSVQPLVDAILLGACTVSFHTRW